jgi:hypothetical protein
MASNGTISLAQLEEILKYLEYASQFPDYPKNFTPPAFVDPHYVAPNRGNVLLIPTIITMVASILVVLLRIWVRTRWHGNQAGWDDWTMLMGLILTVAFSINQILIVTIGGVGTHVYDQQPHTIALGLLVTFRA